MTDGPDDEHRSHRVGVVIPAFEAERFLGPTLESIRTQTFESWTCVIVDDGSGDATAAVAERFVELDGRFELLSQPNLGPARARNLGLAHLDPSVDLVTFMDADDVWEPDALATLVEAIDADPGAIGAHALGDFIDEAGEPIDPGAFASLGRRRLGCRGGRPRPVPTSARTQFEHLVTQSIVFPPGLVLARTDAYRRIDGFDDAARGAEDWDVLIRLSRLGGLAFVDRVLLGYRRHDANAGTNPGVAAACAFVRRRTYFSPENSADQQALVRDGWRAAQVIDARDRIGEVRTSLRERRARDALSVASRLPLVALRYLRGRPGGTGTPTTPGTDR